MKFILLVLLFLSLSFSSELNKKTSLKDITKYIEQKEYKLAYEKLKILYKKDLTNKDVNFFLGVVFLELKEYEKAQVVYERLVLGYPESNIFKFKLAQSYYLQNMKVLSLDTLETIDETKVSNKLKKNIKKLKQLILKEKKNYSFSGSLNFGVFYDDNINNSSFNDFFYVPGLESINNGVLQNSNDEVETYGFMQSLDFNYMYKKNKNLFMINSSFYNKTYKNNKEENLQIVSISPKYIVRYTDKILINYSLFVDHILEDTKGSMTIYGINPSISFMLSNGYLFNTSFSSYIKKNHLESNKDNDSYTNEIGLSLSKSFAQKFQLQNSISYRKEKEKHDYKDNINKSAVELSFFAKYKVNNLFSIGSGVDYKIINYRDRDTFYLAKRKDKTFAGKLFSEYKFDEKQLILVSYKYTNNWSNFDSQEYKKNNFLVNYKYKF